MKSTERLAAARLLLGLALLASHVSAAAQTAAPGRPAAPFDRDPAKLESAKIFKAKLDLVTSDPVYAESLARHRERYEPPAARRKQKKVGP
jgi:hypothetical protein